MKNAFFALCVFSYPLIVYFGLQYIEPQYIAMIFAALFLMRHFTKGQSARAIPHLGMVACVVTLLLGYSVFANSELALKCYPVVMSLSFLSIFGYSLIKGPAVVTLIASLRETLDDKGIAYTRTVTKVWCIFFAVNAAIASWTVLHGDTSLWLFYNGLLSYVIMGILVAVEWLIRKKVKAIHDEIS